MINNRKTEVNDLKEVSYQENAEELFTLNIGCPHCKKPLSLSLAKLVLKRSDTK